MTFTKFHSYCMKNVYYFLICVILKLILNGLILISIFYLHKIMKNLFPCIDICLFFKLKKKNLNVTLISLSIITKSSISG